MGALATRSLGRIFDHSRTRFNCYFQAHSESHQFGERCCLHLQHDFRALFLDGHFARAKLRGYLLVELARDKTLHHLALPRCQPLVPATKLGKFLPLSPFETIPLDRELDGVQ
jgi:hypothetical protein